MEADMTIRQRLDQKQVQKLILAPALQQAIKLLPLTNLELVEAVDEELAQNPMIEIADEEQGRDDNRESPTLEEAGLVTGTGGEAMEPGGEDPDENWMYEAGFQEYLDDGFRPSFDVEKKEAVGIENYLSRTPSLWDHLGWQSALAFTDPEELEIARFIIGNINEEGYLTSSVEEIASLCRAGLDKVESIRERIKNFDPVGSASLDLGEALLVQLDQLQVNDEIARKIIRDHIHLLEKSDFVQLAKVLNLSASELKPHLDLIRSLDPAPGRKYGEEKDNYVVPDILIEKTGDVWNVSLNEEGLPRLRINQYYRQLLAQASRTQPEAYAYLKDRLKKALWFLRSIDQRNQTIYKVARYIVGKQEEFFEKGMDYLRPMTLIEVARAVGVHESTVGRVVANKFIQTPLGVLSLKYFFHKSIPSGQGEDVSSLLIKEKIRKLVDLEDKARPLSDIDIRNLLAGEGIKIARRTVTKYREQLRIEPSHIRKRKFQMEEVK